MARVTVKDLLKNLNIVLEEIPKTVEDAIFSNEERILRMQRQQLYDGKNRLNQDIRPYYSEDPFFKTPGQARGYIAWKQEKTPNAKRNPDAPNLFVKGYTHRNIEIIKQGSEIIFSINPRVIWADEVIDKYDNLLGLNPVNEEYINNEIILPKIWELIHKYV